MRPELARFAVNLEMWWTDRAPIERVAAAAEAGFSRAEIWFWRNWDIPALAAECARQRIEITQIGGWDFEPRMNEAKHHFAFREAMKAATDVAQRLGAPRINVNGPYLRNGEDPSTVRDGVIEALTEAVPVVENSGVTVMIEPMNTRVDHPGYSLASSGAVIDVCRAVDSAALGINWDFYHLQIAEGDLTGHFREGLGWVAYVQIADHPGRHEPGTGEIDHANLLRSVTEMGYDGPIGLECAPSEAPETAVERLITLSHAAGLDARIA